MKSLTFVFLLGLPDPEDRSTMFLRNVDKVTSLHDVTSRNAGIFSNTAVSIAVAYIALSSRTFCLIRVNVWTSKALQITSQRFDVTSLLLKHEKLSSYMSLALIFLYGRNYNG